MNLQLYYISPRDVRKNRSDSVHIVQTCKAFSDNGINVNLICPTVQRTSEKLDKNAIFKLYNIDCNSFNIIELNTKIKEKFGKSNPIIVVFEKVRSILFWTLKNRKKLKSKDSIIYGKCFISVFTIILIKKTKLINPKIVFEILTPKNKLLHKFIIRNADQLISPLVFVTEEIQKIQKISPSKIFQCNFPSLIEELVKISKTKETLRKELGFDDSQKYVLYAGKTSKESQEIDYFIKASKQLKNLTFLIVGANEITFPHFTEMKEKQNLNNLKILPFQTLENYYKYVLASDILIAYYPATRHNSYFVLPGKSTIYFGSNNPCIFSDLPSFRSVFSDDLVFFTPADQPNELVKTIQKIISYPELGMQKAKNALLFAKRNTYYNFCKEILNFIKEK